MPVRCLTATPCTIEPRPSLIFAAWAITVHAFSALSCNIDKTLFLGNNAPQSPHSSFDRISSLNCFKNRSEITQTPLCLSKLLVFGKIAAFTLCFALFLFLSFLPKKCVFCAKNALFRSLFFVCCVLQKTAPKRAVFAFLCLFVFVCDDLFNESLQRKHR